MNYINTKIFTWIALALLTININGVCQTEVINKEISIAFEDVKLKEALSTLEEKSGMAIAYDSRKLSDEKITLSFDKELLSEVLETLLANENLSYKVIGNTITLFSNEKAKPIQAKPKKPAKKIKEEKKFTISGYFMDAKSRETLISATVYVSEINKGISSNEYGFYSMTLPVGSYEFNFSYIGYESLSKEITLDKNIEFSPLLNIENTLEEVIVSDDEIQTQRHSDSKMSSNKISMAKVKSMPVLMGERDVLKMIQLMPGVQSGSEGSTGLYVRGGGPDQNLMLLDGVPIYNVNHLFGFLSTFNGDAIKSAEIIKGGFPARHGGRLSSIIDVRMKEGDMKEIHGDISLGLITGKFNLEGPIIKDKTSFSISGRRSWIDAITTPIQKLNKKENGGTEFFAYNFYDLNAKINHRFSDKSRLYLSTYFGNDQLKNKIDEPFYKEDFKVRWGNNIITGRWNYQINPKLFSNTTLYHSSYDFSLDGESGNPVAGEDFYTEVIATDSRIRDYGGKVDLNWLPNPNHYIRLGVGGIHHQFTPTVYYEKFQIGSETANELTKGDNKIKGNEFTAYIEDDMTLLNKIQLNVGMHFATFNVENSSYASLQPRAALSYLLNEKSSIKLSYSHMTQFLHLLTSPGLGLPTDLWVPSTDRIKPEKSVQYALGYTQSLRNGFELTVEGFYKEMDNLLEYKSGYNIFSNSKEWEDKVLIGAGTSYGGELLIEKKMGKTTGWIGYTLSKSNRSFPDIDNGETFPYKYDRRHDISIAITHKKSERMDFGLVWVYGTGNTYTLGTQNYNAITAGDEPVFSNGLLSTLQAVNHIESRNSQRQPAYHRLDISANFHKEKKRGKRTWSVGFYNLYSRQNPFLVYLEQKPNDILRLQQRSLLPILPFVNYGFAF